MAGYIKLHRGWHESSMFKNEPYCERAAWAWLLSNAAYKDTARVTGKGDEVLLKPGQIHVSDRSLASAWGWDKKRVRRFFAKIEKAKSATAERTTNGTILTIENWDEYQAKGPIEGPQKGPTEDQPRTTQEEGKEIKEEKNYAFAGEIVRLNFADYRKWQDAFPDLDLRAMLTARDAWLTGQSEADRKRWFQSTASWLANKQSEAKRETATERQWEFSGPC